MINKVQMSWILIVLNASSLFTFIYSQMSLEEPDYKSGKVRVSKCCDIGSVIVESILGHRECQHRLNVSFPHSKIRLWRPHFFQDASSNATAPKTRPSYVVEVGFPFCNKHDRRIFAIYHHENSPNAMWLLTNGSLAHQLIHKNGGLQTDIRLYEPGGHGYCVDDLVLLHNNSHMLSEGKLFEIMDFAYICIDQKIGIEEIVDSYAYPIGVTISMSCFILTFLLYIMLPQLRDLTGKFILGICGFMVITFSLILVDVYGWKDDNVEKLMTELLFHTSLVGTWFCLNAMGHDIWKIIRSKSVFTRVTDGQKLCYYSLYVVMCTSVITAVATAFHFFFNYKLEKTAARIIGWNSMGAFYVPILVLFFINVYFYGSSQRQIGHQMLYNKNIQHFQVNFDLYTKFLVAISMWTLFQTMSLFDKKSLIYIGKIFNILQGPLIFFIAMCRTRVLFLFKRYFCLEGAAICCQQSEFLEQNCQELATIDSLRNRDTAAEILLPTFASGSTNDMCRSLFNVRNRDNDGCFLPVDEDRISLGRIAKRLKSNSLNALANLNWGWRRETTV